MLKNYIRVALRNMKKNPGFTVLNLMGLSLGLIVALLILFYVVDEWSYDRYNVKADRIYRINTDVKFGTTQQSFAQGSPAIGEALVRTFPEVGNSVRFATDEGVRFKKGDMVVLEDRVTYCDPQLFDIFTLPGIEGDLKTALKEPNSVVITESTAKKYFNRKDNVVGQTLTILGDSGRTTIEKITAVIRDIPKQSHFNFDFFLSMTSLPQSHEINFSSLSFTTYLLLKPGADAKKLQAQFPAFLRKALAGQAWDMDAFDKSGNYIRINLTPLKDIHLRSNRVRELGRNGDEQYIFIFSAIALFVLLIACINFMNLSTARSSNRAREVGVRKVLGSPRRQLVFQFLTESVLVALGAVLVAFLGAWLLLPFFNDVADKELAITWNALAWIVPSLLVIAVVVGLLAGCYPAFFLSGFQPIEVLKGKLSAGFKGSNLRSSLVVFQFSISVFLIIGTIVMYEQLNYMQHRKLGFDRDQVLVIKNLHTVNNPKLLQQQIQRLPNVIDATLTTFLPTDTKRFPNFVTTENVNLQTELWPVDEQYLHTMNMGLVKGRNFSNQFATDSTAMIVNEQAAGMLGFQNDPIDKIIYRGQQHIAYHIIGVVKDFNFSSLRNNISPLVMTLMTPSDWPWAGDNLSVKVSTSRLAVLLPQIEGLWNESSPGQRMAYSFMDDDFDAMYRVEQRMNKIFILFTIMSIAIACLGLFGLTAYAAEQRKKEISIRKVLGADVPAVVLLLSGNFMKLVLIASAIGLPVAWLVMQKWLGGFAFRKDIQWWYLVIAPFMVLIVAFVTVSFQAVKAALANPVRNMRSE